MTAEKSTVWLVAEDSEDDFLLLQRAFRKVAPKAKLFWVKDGVEAQSYLRGDDRFTDRAAFPLPTVTLADIKMPKCTGLELLAWIRRRPELHAMPLIVFSSSAQPSDVAEAYQLQANWYLSKPSTLDQLVETLRRLFEHSRLDWAA